MRLWSHSHTEAVPTDHHGWTVSNWTTWVSSTKVRLLTDMQTSYSNWNTQLGAELFFHVWAWPDLGIPAARKLHYRVNVTLQEPSTMSSTFQHHHELLRVACISQNMYKMKKKNSTKNSATKAVVQLNGLIELIWLNCVWKHTASVHRWSQGRFWSPVK